MKAYNSTKHNKALKHHSYVSSRVSDILEEFIRSRLAVTTGVIEHKIIKFREMKLTPKYYSYIPSNVSGILEEFVRIRLTVAFAASKYKNTKFRKLIKLRMKQG